jgi:hypothetical protein
MRSALRLEGSACESDLRPRLVAGPRCTPARRLNIAQAMQQRHWLRGLVLAGILIGLAPASTHAAEVRSADAVVVGADETIEDDLYAFGRFVVVQGRVNGDVIAFGETISVTGTVTGDVIAAGRTVGLGGQVDGSARVAGNTITVDGRIGQDLIVASGSVLVSPSGRVERDVLAGSGSATLHGPVGRDVVGGVGTVDLIGTVGRTVRVGVGRLRLADTAVVGGDLIYESEAEATIAPGARVDGRIERRVPERRERTPGPLDLAIDWLRALVGLLALGLVVVLVFPGFSRRTVEVLRTSPWGSLGIGFALFLGMPVAAAFVFGLGLVVGGWWLGPVALAVYAILLAISLPLAGLFVGRWALDRLGQRGIHGVWALLLGLVLLTLVGLVPWIGPLVIAVAALFALGALTRAALTRREAAIPP